MNSWILKDSIVILIYTVNIVKNVAIYESKSYMT